MPLSALAQDTRHSIRLASRRRAFNVGMVATVALVVGASTSIFAVLYGVLFRRLPFTAAERLVMLWESNRDTGLQHLPLTEGAYALFRQRLLSFEAIAAFIPRKPGLPPVTIAETGERIKHADATPELFQLLGATPLLGRVFSAAESELYAPGVTVLSYRFWKTRFGGRADVIGQPVVLNRFGWREQYMVVGVMREGFEFPHPLFPEKPDLWLSLQYDHGSFSLGNNFYVIGKLKHAGTLVETQAELMQAARRISVEQPRYYGPASVQVVPLRAESLRNAKSVAAALIGALLLVTLIGCANVTHLALARAAWRRREIATRVALGATRWDLFRVTTVELGLLVALGGALGLLLAVWGVSALVALLPPQLYIPRADALVFGAPMVLFATATSLVGALALGLAPCIRLNNGELANNLRSPASPPTAGGASLFRRPGSILLVCEVALAFALVSGATVMLETVRRLLADGARMNPDRLLALDVFFSNDAAAGSESTVAAYDAFLLDSRAVRGVSSIALVDHYPLAEHFQNFKAESADGPIARAAQPAELHVVTPSYADIVGLRVREGRWLNDLDRGKAPAVAVVNESMAQRYFSGGRPLGTRLRGDIRRSDEWPVEWQVVGVIQEPQRLGGAHAHDAPPAVYVPFAQAPMRNVTVVVRTDSSARKLAGIMRDHALRMLPGVLAIENIQTGTDMVASSTARSKFVSRQLTALGVLALVLASLGTYSVVSFQNSQRAREIAVRMALGSTGAQAVALIVRQAMLLVGAGVAGGAPLAFGTVRLLGSLRPDTSLMDAVACLAATAVFCCVGLAASFLSARRAAWVDPVDVLRSE